MYTFKKIRYVVCIIVQSIKDLIATHLTGDGEPSEDVRILRNLLVVMTKQVCEFGKEDMFTEIFKDNCFGHVREEYFSADDYLAVEDIDVPI